MGTMSSSDAAPLPRAGEVFFDVRGNARTMRVSWYGDTGVAVFSIWNGGTCTGTFRLPIPELPRMIDALSRGPGGAAAPPAAARGSQQLPPGAADPGPPTAAMQFAGAQGYQDGPGYEDVPHGYSGPPAGYQDGPAGYQDGPNSYQDATGYARFAPGYEDDQPGYPDGPHGYEDSPQRYPDGPQGYPDDPREFQEAGPGYGGPPPRYAGGRHGYDEPAGADPGRPYYQPAGDDDAGAEPPYPGPGIDELGADPLEADYGGEAEQGFLPGPPTETFSPVAVGGSHSRHAGRPAGPAQAGPGAGGYRPAPDQPEEPEDGGGYPAYARPQDSASESLAYHPGRAGRREREYRPPRGGY
jgi:hypothetical protein